MAEAVTGDKSSTVPVSIRIIDTNDNNPSKFVRDIALAVLIHCFVLVLQCLCLCLGFEKEQYKVYLAENAKPGTSVVRIQATDMDSGSYGTPGIRYTALTGSLAKQYSGFSNLFESLKN